MIFTNTFGQYEKLLLQHYNVSSTIRHKGERGRQREDGLRKFLNDNLPTAYGVATGEIIPYCGNTPSPQCDIIIYDKLRFPILGKGDSVQQVPLEAVYFVIECKSQIDAKAIVDAQKKIHLIRQLPRCPSQTSLKKGKKRGPFFTLFGYRLKSSKEACTKFMSDSAKHFDVDIVALDSGCGVWISDQKRAVWLNATDKSQNFHETLLIYFIGLLEDLRSIELGNPHFSKLFYSNE